MQSVSVSFSFPSSLQPRTQEKGTFPDIPNLTFPNASFSTGVFTVLLFARMAIAGVFYLAELVCNVSLKRVKVWGRERVYAYIQAGG
jgi:hypothetical protein